MHGKTSCRTLVPARGGTRQTVADFAKTQYFAPEEMTKLPGAKEAFLHTEKIFLVDVHGHIRGVYNGTLPVEANHILADVQGLQSQQ